MTASMLTDPNVVTCPKCGKDVWDNRLTKKGNQPDYRCKNRACDGAIWLKPKGKKDAPKPVSQGHPEFLANQEAEDAAELAGKIGQPKKPTMRHAYKELTAWVMDEILPMYCEDELTMTAADVAAITATLFIQACKSGKVE